MTSTHKMNRLNKRSSPTFSYILPACWCLALLTSDEDNHALNQIVIDWLDEHGQRRPFMASEVFPSKPENDLRAGWITQPCREYYFSR